MINLGKLKLVAVKDCWKVKFSHLCFLSNALTASPYHMTNNRAIHELRLLEHFFAPVESENVTN